MLIGLWIRDVVLIEALDLSIGPGLTALTGETGAGKSIILDALGLATGARADAGPGAARRAARRSPRPSSRPRPTIPSGTCWKRRASPTPATRTWCCAAR